MEESIYIACLKKGHECGRNGITYWEMIDHLKTDHSVDVSSFEFHQYFFVWFYDNFYLAANYVDRRQNRYGKTNQDTANQPVNPALWFNLSWLSDRYGHPKYDGAKPNGQLDLKVQMMFEAQQRYFEYLSMLENGRKSDTAINLALSSNKLSKTAIGITFLSLLITAIIGGAQVYYAKIGYEDSRKSRVLETTDKAVQQELLELKEQLKQTNMLLFRPAPARSAPTNTKLPAHAGGLKKP